MRHLSDEIIQDYLDSKRIIQSDLVQSHLVICPACKDKLERYKELYLELSEKSEFELGRNFNKTVIRAIDAAESRVRVEKYLFSVAAMLGLALVLFTLDYLGTISVNAIYMAVSADISGWLTPTISTIGLLLEKLNGNLEILAFAGIAALIFQFLDRSIIQAKLKRF